MYHHTNLGVFGRKVQEHADIDGFIPEAGDGPWDLRWDHGTETTHNEDGTLTAYGAWWAEEWPSRREMAVRATSSALQKLGKWRTT